MKNLFARFFHQKTHCGGDRICQQADDTPTFKNGTIISNGILISRFLGRGGFGEVYLAVDAHVRAAYALKTIRTDLLSSRSFRDAFKREALLWVNLDQHPFILAARRVHEFSRRLFVGMDYVAPDAAGRVSLAHHLAATRGPLDTDAALRWAIQFCYGMEHAFQRGMKCHRDIKPSNILITSDGTLKISDFSLAVAAEAAWKERADPILTSKRDGSFGLSLFNVGGRGICGTPGYVAPEIVLGHQADVRSDIYSFGLVMWQIAAGSRVPPFHVPYEKCAGPDEYMRRVLDQQLKGRVPRVKGPIQSAINRCLAPDPRDRYAGFEQLRNELEPSYRGRTGTLIQIPEKATQTSDAWINKGWDLWALGRSEEAMACFDKALKINPLDAWAWRCRAELLRVMARCEEAMVCVNRSLEIDPKSSPAWLCKSKILWAQLLEREAINCVDKALELEPEDEFAWKDKGMMLILWARGLEREATSRVDKAPEIEPGNERAWNNKVFMLSAVCRYEEALQCLNTAVRVRPLLASAWHWRGLVLLKLGRTDEGNASLAKALEIDPQWKDDLEQASRPEEPDVEDEDIPF
ncbi:MAG TPA: serine/threonine-protein kinase [Candidatus Sulfotelmatobacter sp.]|nr:serine/threonine-protein kinase [Candidatus Sulfotelmatobacter sp.]